MRSILTAPAVLPGFAWAHGESDSLMHYLTAPDHAMALVTILAVAVVCLGVAKRLGSRLRALNLPSTPQQYLPDHRSNKH